MLHVVSSSQAGYDRSLGSPRLRGSQGRRAHTIGTGGRKQSRPVESEMLPGVRKERGEGVLVFEDVPAEVCDVFSDMLLSPNTIRHLEELMEHAEPNKRGPVYTYA